MSVQPPAIADLRIERTLDPRKRSRWSRWPWGRVLIALVIAAVVAYYLMRPKLVEVEAATVTLVYPSQSVTLLSATGYVVPQRKADIASKATGRVASMEVEAGQSVTTGQVLARLENQDVQANLAEAEARSALSAAEVKQAEAELWIADLSVKRLQDLVERKLVSKADLDNAISRQRTASAGLTRNRAALKAQQAAVDSARVALEYTLIRAPFEGVVLKKSADIGDVVAPFAATSLSKGAVVTMADMSSLQVEADVSESNLGKVKVDQACEIQLDALPETRLEGRVQRIVPTVDRAKATVTVKVRFLKLDPRVLPDMSAKVAFLERALSADEHAPHLGVTSTAIQEGYAYLIDGDRARRIPVQTAGTQDTLALIKDGLASGNEVVAKPPPGLVDGALIARKQP